MKLKGFIAALIALFTFTITAHAGQFPTIKAENLNKVQMTLPADFGARRSIVFVAYKQNQQNVVNTWLPFASQAAKKSGVKYFETPVVSSSYKLMSGFINNGMRSGIQDTGTRAKTITLFTNVGKFNKLVGLSGTNTIHVIVLDRNGKVLAKQSGAYTQDKAKAISAAL
jgi:hypothetical protein